MKKIVFSTIFLLLTIGSVQAASMGEVFAAVKHAHPLPNFMQVIKKHGDKLDLSEEQQQEIDAWIEKQRPVATKIALSIRDDEKVLKEAALNGASKENMTAQLDELLKKRKKIAEMKMDCRDKMRQLLGDEKWQKVVDLYKGM
ncbi:secreted protein [Beggiatoa sp. PS]|nr:secreted protein [Beggiatoa sp. PS]